MLAAKSQGLGIRVSAQRCELLHPTLDLKCVRIGGSRRDRLLSSDNATEATELFGKHAGGAAAAGEDLQRQRP